MWAVEIDGVVRMHAQTVEAAVPAVAAFADFDLAEVKNVILKRVQTDDPDIAAWMDLNMVDGKDPTTRNLVITKDGKTVFVDGAVPVRTKKPPKAPVGVFSVVEFAADWVGKEKRPVEVSFPCEWEKLSKTPKDLDDVWKLGDWVLRCQMIYPEKLGGGANWIIERADRMPITKNGSTGLMLAFFDHMQEAPLQKAYEIIKGYEDELAAIW